MSDLETRAIGRSPYNYTPTKWICITFVSLFSVSTCLHLAQAIIYRLWFMLPTAVFCGVIEILGWSARTWSSISPNQLRPYEIQMTATILGPTPLLAANFLTLGRIVERLGPRYCRLAPKTYSMIFLGCDLVALAVQGVGGALASLAVGHKKSPETGGHIMLGGIVFQMAAITAYVFLATEFLVRYATDAPIAAQHGKGHRGALTPRLKMLVGALTLNTLCLIVRAIYRTIELIDDGAMIVLAIFIVNFAHPGMLLKEEARGVGQAVKTVDVERDSASEVVEMKARRAI
ncbi:RTA1 like protein-domain-containing protein [Mycena latifolia]|nr:RTA1 like protein-domain-containing protein [Mycena latifolia]